MKNPFHPCKIVEKLKKKRVVIFRGACMPPDYFYKWFIIQFPNESDWTCAVENNFLLVRNVSLCEMKFPICD